MAFRDEVVEVGCSCSWIFCSVSSIHASTEKTFARPPKGQIEDYLCWLLCSFSG